MSGFVIAQPQHCFDYGLFVVSLQTEKGSALHEAALFGKTDVVQKLLREGQTLTSPFSQHAYKIQHVSTR